MRHTDRILFVDDDPKILAAFARTFREEGFQLDVALDHEAAMAAAAEHAYAVIAVDYIMPRVSGLELIDQLRDLQPDASFMLVSGSCDLPLALQAVNGHGVTFVVPKPWSDTELGSLVRRAMELHWERSLGTELARAHVAICKRLDHERARLAGRVGEECAPAVSPPARDA